MQAGDCGEPSDILESRRFREEEKFGVASLAGWVGHPAVQPAVLKFAPYAEAAMMPLDPHLDSQPDVIWFCWTTFEMTPLEPGWVRRGHTWMLTRLEHQAVESARASIRVIAASAARTIAADGARVDTGWDGDLTVIAELVILEGVSGFTVPRHLSARELAEALQPPGASAIKADARGTEHRRGISERAERNAGALRRSYEEHLFGPKTPAPYAGGGTRASRKDSRQRRGAMRAVLTAYPDVTGARIHATYSGSALRSDRSPASPGGYLRHLLGGNQRCPSVSTLNADLKLLRSEASDGSGEKSAG